MNSITYLTPYFLHVLSFIHYFFYPKKLTILLICTFKHLRESFVKFQFPLQLILQNLTIIILKLFLLYHSSANPYQFLNTH